MDELRSLCEEYVFLSRQLDLVRVAQINAVTEARRQTEEQHASAILGGTITSVVNVTVEYDIKIDALEGRRSLIREQIRNLLA